MSRLRVALAKGRLYEPSVERFRRAGAAPVPDAGRRLLIPSSDPGIEFPELCERIVRIALDAHGKGG